MPFSYDEIDELMQSLHDGRVNKYALPAELYFAIAEYLKRGLYEGFEMTFSEAAFGTIEYDLIAEMRANIYIFSAAKTYQQVREMTDMLAAEKGVLPFNEFKKEAQKIYNKYNVDWLKSEYNTAIGQAQTANKWKTILSEQDVMPYLRYDAIGDACPICKPLDGIVAPVNHPIWRKISPLNHFNCFCIVLQEGKGIKPTNENQLYQISNQFDPVVSPQFAMNPYYEKVVFNQSAPYFTNVPNEDRGYAMNNFNLNIPSND